MIAILDSLGPMIWRATWQASLLAVLVAVILWCCGDRLAPRWRFLMWGVVLMRLMVVITPGSSFSLFNLASFSSNSSSESIAWNEIRSDNDRAPTKDFDVEAKDVDNKPPVAVVDDPKDKSQLRTASVASATSIDSNDLRSLSAEAVWTNPKLITRVLMSIWLAGVALLSLKLVASTTLLRRRLAGCQTVTDTAILELLEALCREMNIRRAPALLVTPENVSPYIVGPWRARIVLPESVVTESSPQRLRHVFAHELSHLARRDLWTNWLLIAARILHWFNPLAWIVVREMQAEREAACDEMALSLLGEKDRSSYADSIIELVANLRAPGIATGLIGFFSAKARLQQRIERFLHAPSSKSFWTPICVAMLVVVALSSLTDAQPPSPAAAPPVESKELKESKEPKEKPNSDKKKTAATNTGIVKGRCLEATEGTPVAGVTVRLYKSEGRTAPPVEIAKTISDKDGKYEFTGLEPERSPYEFNQLHYSVMGFAEGRPIGRAFGHREDGESVTEIRMSRKSGTLSGKVVDAKGQPVKGATVSPYFLTYGLPPNVPFATTDTEGRFKVENVGIMELSKGRMFPIGVSVRHPEYPKGHMTVESLDKEITATLPDGCVVTGSVFDRVTGKPAQGAEISAQRLDANWGALHCETDASGKFRTILQEGHYNFSVKAKDRVSSTYFERECVPGKNVELSRFELVGGGFISGTVVNTKTGKSISFNKDGKPISIGVYGPGDPLTARVISPIRMATVDNAGHFTVRVYPGSNYPYFVNIQGNRMAWDTHKDAAVVVKEGETTNYNMLITPKPTDEEKLQAAQKVIDNLSKNASDRTAQILLEFRKLNHTVDETELWCSLMRELVTIGPNAVPQLCVELDQTNEGNMVRRLGFALRAIGDPRAVPALIRVIPKTLHMTGGGYGLAVANKELAKFMRKHDMDEIDSHDGLFSLGGPVNETFSALHRLTNQNFDDDELRFISANRDPRRRVLQQRLFNRQAARWETWWNANWQTLTKGSEYSKVELKTVDEEIPDAPKNIAKDSSLPARVSGAVVSPLSEKGKHAAFFYDLDTGNMPTWPKEFPRDESKLDNKQLDDWAAKNGADLICVTHKSPDGNETYQLRAIGMQVVEIDARNARNIDQLIASGTLPEGRPVGELLMHFNPKTEKLEPNAHGTYLFTTREGNRGVLTTTDRIIRTDKPSGLPVLANAEPSGIGFRLGVQFRYSDIVPPQAE